jgi:hypothetical protein
MERDQDVRERQAPGRNEAREKIGKLPKSSLGEKGYREWLRTETRNFSLAELDGRILLLIARGVNMGRGQEVLKAVEAEFPIRFQGYMEKGLDKAIEEREKATIKDLRQKLFAPRLSASSSEERGRRSHPPVLQGGWRTESFRRVFATRAEEIRTLRKCAIGREKFARRSREQTRTEKTEAEYLSRYEHVRTKDPELYMRERAMSTREKALACVRLYGTDQERETWQRAFEVLRDKRGGRSHHEKHKKGLYGSELEGLSKLDTRSLPLAQARAVEVARAMILIGCRPCEMKTAVFNPEKLTVSITGAKQTNGRGRDRIIGLRGLTVEEREAVKTGLSAAKDLCLSHASRDLKRAFKKIWPDRDPSRLPILYDARHQFSSDMKASAMPEKDLAAAMGHRSTETAKKSYGRAIGGRNRPLLFVR